ncbi:MAG: type II toxin-antitoxin system HicB family antitoxin [Flavobacteriales bacterium]|nr:type II toxin-antitoxin system HicB family antitoxin [Flavobacteriales bacterium]MCC6911602.1 type II toxin-antitoxin system HicB family antitoxin [Flavobacteriales bacterium]
MIQWKAIELRWDQWRGLLGSRTEWLLALVDQANGECCCRGGHEDKGRDDGLVVALWNSTMNHTLQVIIEQDKDGYFAYVPELKYCHTQGDSMEEEMTHIEEAVDLHIKYVAPGGDETLDEEAGVYRFNACVAWLSRWCNRPWRPANHQLNI